MYGTIQGGYHFIILVTGRASNGCVQDIGEINVFSTLFELKKFGDFVIGSSKDSSTKDYGWIYNQII